MKIFYRKKGFTIIELTIVISLIAVLALIIMPNSNNLIQKAQNTVSDLNEKTIQQASIMGSALNNSVPNVSRLADISDIGGIEDITVNYTGSDNLYLLISTDGQTWYSYRDEINISKTKILADKSLIQVDITKTEDIRNKAMSYSLFNDLSQTDWSNIINNSDQVSFAYYLEDQENNDITSSNQNIKLTVQGTNKTKEISLSEEKTETDLNTVIKDKTLYINNNEVKSYNNIIYVDIKNGSDSNGDGSLDNPFKNFYYAYDNYANSGDLVYLKEGTYALKYRQQDGRSSRYETFYLN